MPDPQTVGPGTLMGIDVVATLEHPTFNNFRTSEFSFCRNPPSIRVCRPHWIHAVEVQRSPLDVGCISPAFPINAEARYCDYCIKKGNPKL
jgi:hypothetical protein